MIDLNITLFEDEIATIKAAKKDRKRLFIEPFFFLSSFIIQKWYRYLVMPIPKELYKLSNQKRNVNVADVDKKILKSPLNALKKDMFSISKNIEYILDKDSDIYVTPTSIIILLWYLKEKKGISYDIGDEAYINKGIDMLFSNYLNDNFYPLALERLIKLYSMFYLKHDTSSKIKCIGAFQASLRKHSFDNVQSLEEVTEIFKKEAEYLLAIGIPDSNIANKILEMLRKLENLLQFQNDVIISKDRFMSCRLSSKKEEEMKKNLYQYIFQDGEYTDDIKIFSPF